METKNPVKRRRKETPFEKKDRRERCVQWIVEETGIGRYEATVAYQIAVRGLRAARLNGEDGGYDR